jgi:non-ribosomal peptide synthase protein (TIGR01720 family)
LKVDKAITESELQASIEQIVLQHDVMRFKYYQKEGQWQQENSAATIGLIREDISGTSSTPEVLINEIGDKYQRSLNIEKGEISRIVWIETPAKETANRLLLIIHHLAVDGVSWRILVEDLQICLTAVKNNLALTSLPKSSSYKQWYEALLKYGKKSSTLAQLQYWRNTVRGFQPFEVDFNFTDQVFVKDTATFTVRLKSDDTYALLKDVPRVYHTEINDILLCSLAKVLCSWANKSNIVICLEGHGRESIDDRIDSSRTVGWFTSLYPVLINIEEQNVLGDLIKSVKEQLRQIPDKGLGYGVLRYLNKETVLQGREPWEFQFNYLGQLDTLVKESKWLAIGGEPTGSGQNEEQIVTEKISVTSYIKAGELVCVWRFSTRHFKEETIKKLASSYLSELAAIISHCLQQGQAGGVYTPSDYGLGSAISFKELDAFLEEDNDSIMSF